MEIENGELCYFWSSNWTPFGKISTFLHDQAPTLIGIPRDSTVDELWEIDHWVLPAARSDKQVQLYSFLTSLTLSNQSDSMIWAPSGNNETTYCTRRIYNLIREQGAEVTWSKEVWFSRGIPKYSFLTWLMVLNRCPTKDRLLQWGLQTDGTCSLSNMQLESRDHLFFYCAYSWEIWFVLASRCSIPPLRSWEATIAQLQHFAGRKAHRYLLLLVWQATIYHSWQERNNRIHRSSFKSAASIIFELDKVIRQRIASIRQLDIAIGSEMFSLWFSTS
ncbi:uncharacterized protein LOC108858402 [Raphanus sativus]|uniref:Uncharacterized protein LOC108858402 n=1 Tax=Raphanus sativus TaxID=3726 RepID=A0A6J0NTR2_RAPSA|nr:uncharacterized protein LOC108858402 [Raphanus sativus]